MSLLDYYMPLCMVVVSSGDGMLHHAVTACYRRLAQQNHVDVDTATDVQQIPVKFGHIPTGRTVGTVGSGGTDGEGLVFVLWCCKPGVNPKI